MAFYIKGVKKSEHGYKVLNTEEDITLPTDDRMNVNLHGEKYIFNTYYDKEGDNIRKNHIVTLTHNNITQCLIHVAELNLDMAERVTVLFVGDVDGDRELDCIINVNTYVEKEDELYFQYLLYLSSEAEEGQLVKYVAKYTGKVPTMGEGK